MKKAMHPNSLKNLKPPFRAGEERPDGASRSCGATMREWLNVFAGQELGESDLRKISRDKKEPWNKRAAAKRAIRTLEDGDLADFSGLLRGENNLEDLRGMGIDTAVVKKFKQKTRRVPTGEGKETEEVIEREIELHDRGGEDFYKVTETTDGFPAKTVNVNANHVFRTPADRDVEASSIADRLRAILKPSNS